MILKKLNLVTLLLFIFINIQINSMEEQITEQKISYIEKLPNELLLEICYLKIHDIINNNDSIRAKEEFKSFKSSICLTKKRFYQFKNDLEQYFDNHKIEISDVTITQSNISFKVNYQKFILQDEPSILDQFITDVITLSNKTLSKIGKAIVLEVEKISDETIRRQMFARLFATIIFAPYDEAEMAGDKEKAMQKIKELVKPIFRAYPEQEHNLFTNNLNKYGLNKNDLKTS